ncbi:Hypothetical protein, putative [Bodo saltans]|uniref:Uncharacterized protein n=1 Tax=Bodo saltans TaxID=75058 RepID=A0A0S4IXL8_BODSA|nr:Hypothetical protein, putative [Bodo saltans]|eukprot:CUG42283.1 Hypothetical protein, putative [Bodo saltans]
MRCKGCNQHSSTLSLSQHEKRLCRHHHFRFSANFVIPVLHDNVGAAVGISIRCYSGEGCPIQRKRKELLLLLLLRVLLPSSLLPQHQQQQQRQQHCCCWYATNNVTYYNVTYNPFLVGCRRKHDSSRMHE